MPVTEHYKNINDFIDSRYQKNAYSSRAQTRAKYDFALNNKQAGFTISLGSAKIKGRHWHVFWILDVLINMDNSITTVKRCI